MSTIIRELTDIQGAAVSAPSQSSFTSTGMEAFASDAAYEIAHPSPGAGASYFNTTLDVIRSHNGTSWQQEKGILEAFADDADYEAAHAAVTGARYLCTNSSPVVREYNGSAWQNTNVWFTTEVNSSLTGSNQDLVPGGNHQVIKVTNASLTSIGTIAPNLKKLIVLVNETGVSISLKNEYTLGTSVSRILTGTGVDLTLKAGASVWVAYDDNASRWRVVGGSGSGSGSGTEINCIGSPSDTVGWGSSGGTAATTTTTAAECPLYGIVNTAIKITRTTASGYDYYRWTMPSSLKNMLIPISWFQICESGSANGDFKLDLYVNSASNYAGSYTRKALKTDVSSVTSIPGATGFFGAGNQVCFDSSTDDYYELRVVRVTNTKYLSLAKIKVGFDNNQVAPSSGEYESVSSFTIGATTTAPTPGSGTTLYRNTYKDGRWAIIRYEIRQTAGGSSGSGDYLLPLPTGLSIDYGRASLQGVQAVSDVGSGTFRSGTTDFDAKGYIANSGSYANKVYVAVTGDATPLSTWSSSFGGLAAASIVLSLTVRIPIVGWEDSVLVGPSANLQIYSSTNGTWDAAAAAGNTVPGFSPISGALTSNRLKVVRLPYAPQSMSDVKLVFMPSGYTAPVGQEGWRPLIITGSVSYGAQIVALSGTDVSVQFYQYSCQGSSFNSTGQNWASSDGAWGLVVANPSQPVGIPYGQLDGSPQLYKAGYAPGLNTGAAIAAGMIGEKIEIKQVGSSANFPTSNNYGDFASSSLPLTKGRWRIGFQIWTDSNGATCSQVLMGIGTSSGNVFTPIYGDNCLSGPPPTSTANGCMTITDYIVDLAADTTYYGKVLATYSAGTPQYRGRLTATRM